MTELFGHRVIQNAWVVDDLVVAAQAWHDALGIGPFLVTRDIPVVHARYRGAPGGPRFSTAIAQSGDVQIELVQQHDDAPSIYREQPSATLPRFHHAGILADDFDAVVAQMTADGATLASEGRVGALRFAFVDTQQSLGCMIEIVERSPMIEKFFAAVRKASERWDRDPATLIRIL